MANPIMYLHIIKEFKNNNLSPMPPEGQSSGQDAVCLIVQRCLPPLAQGQGIANLVPEMRSTLSSRVVCKGQGLHLGVWVHVGS